MTFDPTATTANGARAKSHTKRMRARCAISGKNMSDQGRLLSSPISDLLYRVWFIRWRAHTSGHLWSKEDPGRSHAEEKAAKTAGSIREG